MSLPLKAVIAISFLLICFSSRGQVFSKQVSFTWDNDYFMLRGTDRYYTNGLFFQYHAIGNTRKPGSLKKIVNLEIGQMIYKQFVRKLWPTPLVSNYYPGGC